MGPFALYRRLIGVSIRSQLQYRVSFIMSSLAALLVTGGEFLGLWALFARFGDLGGWTLGQICVF
ncbi:MAG TPA: ABC transporter permease, partial [Myxococcota bacterium]|nr:ABC transporter permease [Myxococcota bacterium]